MAARLLQGRRSKAVDDGVNASPARLGALQAVAAVLASPLSLEQIAAVVADAATELLDAEILVIAIHVDDPRHLRTVHASGLSRRPNGRLAALPSDKASVLSVIEQYLGGNGSPRTAGALDVLPIPQMLCPPGLIVAGRVDARPFSHVDRAFAAVLAGLCGLALDRLRLSSERARARAALRRRRQARETAESHLQVGDIDIDLVGQSISLGGRAAMLTPSELRLLMFLAEEPGRPRSRQEILRHLWHSEHVGDERACDVHISNLRRKIESDPARPARLVTVRGVGYALIAREGASRERSAPM
jgi:DNA-binding winged helix-turn-helix (wHTH) protein